MGGATGQGTWRRSLRQPEALAAILVLMAVAVMLLVVSAVAARRPMTSTEIEIFRAVNDLPPWLHTPRSGP